jgi:hypothetical protein
MELGTLSERISKFQLKRVVGYQEFKEHKPWFTEGYLKVLDQRKQAKLQWLQNPSEINGDNLDN